MTKEADVNTSKVNKVIKVAQLQLAKDVVINLIRDCDVATKEKILDVFNESIERLQK